MAFYTYKSMDSLKWTGTNQTLCCITILEKTAKYTNNSRLFFSDKADSFQKRSRMDMIININIAYFLVYTECSNCYQVSGRLVGAGDVEKRKKSILNAVVDVLFFFVARGQFNFRFEIFPFPFHFSFPFFFFVYFIIIYTYIFFYIKKRENQRRQAL
jgi:hypothetical protein